MSTPDYIAAAIPLLAIGTMIDADSSVGKTQRQIISVARVLKDEITVSNDLAPVRYTFSDPPSTQNVALISGTSMCSDEVADIIATNFSPIAVIRSVVVDPIVDMMTDGPQNANIAKTSRNYAESYMSTSAFLLGRVEALCNGYYVALRSMGSLGCGVPPSMVMEAEEADSRLASQEATAALTASVVPLSLGEFVNVIFESTVTMSERRFHRMLSRLFNEQTCRISAYRAAATDALYAGHARPLSFSDRRDLAASLIKMNSGRVAPPLLKYIVKDVNLLHALGLLDAVGIHGRAHQTQTKKRSEDARDEMINAEDSVEEEFADMAVALFTLLEAFPVASCCGAHFVEHAEAHLQSKDKNGRTIFEAYCDNFAEVIVRFAQHFDSVQVPPSQQVQEAIAQQQLEAVRRVQAREEELRLEREADEAYKLRQEQHKQLLEQRQQQADRSPNISPKRRHQLGDQSAPTLTVSGTTPYFSPSPSKERRNIGGPVSYNLATMTTHGDKAATLIQRVLKGHRARKHLAFLKDIAESRQRREGSLPKYDEMAPANRSPAAVPGERMVVDITKHRSHYVQNILQPASRSRSPDRSAPRNHPLSTSTTRVDPSVTALASASPAAEGNSFTKDPLRPSLPENKVVHQPRPPHLDPSQQFPNSFAFPSKISVKVPTKPTSTVVVADTLRRHPPGPLRPHPSPNIVENKTSRGGVQRVQSPPMKPLSFEDGLKQAELDLQLEREMRLRRSPSQ